MATFTDCLCPAIQQSLNDIAGRNAYALRRDKVGYLMFLLSPENTSGFEKIKVDPGNGKKKTVRINYYNKWCTSDVQDSCDDNCSTGTEVEPLCEDVTVDHCISSGNLVFDEDNLRLLCEPLAGTDATWKGLLINGLMNAMLVTLDQNLITAAAAAFGNFMDGDVIKNVRLVNTINDNYDGPRPYGLINFQDEFDQAALYGVPNVIGAGQVAKYFNALGLGSVTSAIGFDMTKLGGAANFFYDRFVEGVIGVDEFIVQAPGVAQALLWNRYKGEYAKKTETFEHGTIIDPITGVEFDLKMHYKDCKDTYYIKLELNWDFWSMPDDAEASCGEHYGVNGIFNYKHCDDLNECVGTGTDSSSYLD